MTTTCTYLQQLTQVSDVAHGPLVLVFVCLFVYGSDMSFCVLADASVDAALLVGWLFWV